MYHWAHRGIIFASISATPVSSTLPALTHIWAQPNTAIVTCFNLINYTYRPSISNIINFRRSINSRIQKWMTFLIDLFFISPLPSRSSFSPVLIYRALKNGTCLRYPVYSAPERISRGLLRASMYSRGNRKNSYLSARIITSTYPRSSRTHKIAGKRRNKKTPCYKLSPSMRILSSHWLM